MLTRSVGHLGSFLSRAWLATTVAIAGLTYANSGCGSVPADGDGGPTLDASADAHVGSADAGPMERDGGRDGSGADSDSGSEIEDAGAPDAEVRDGGGLDAGSPSAEWLVISTAFTRSSGSTSAGDGPAVTCAIRDDHSLWCWGSNDLGQIGQGSASTAPRLAPVRVGLDADWAHVSASGHHVCALKEDGTLWCWGDSRYGAVGVAPVTVPRPAPVRVGAESDWVSVVTNGASRRDRAHSCGVRGDGTLWCWGANALGAFGAGGSADEPRRVGDGADWRSVSTGEQHTCGIHADGSLWCWGRNVSGQLGDGTLVNRDAPVRAGGDDWAEVAVGQYDTCALRTDGSLYCWGQLQTVWTAPITVPTPVGGEARFVQLAKALRHLCAIRTDGELHCLGANDYGQLGDGSTLTRAELASVVGTARWIQVSAGPQVTCGLREDRSAWCWGRNQAGRLGQGVVPDQEAPLRIGADAWASLATATQASCGIRSDESLWCWGTNDAGRLGDGTLEHYDLPQRVVAEPGAGWRQVALSHGHACGIRRGGSLLCWGSNAAHALGVGSGGPPRLEPVPVGGATSWSSVTTGAFHTCGTADDGGLLCWGINSYGQLGTGEGPGASASTPVRIGGDASWYEVRALAEGACARRTDGTLHCWGRNDRGELGIGSTTGASVPTQEATAATWRSFDVGEAHGCAIRDPGALFCWGSNWYGQVGVAGVLNATAPTRVGASSSWRQVSAGHWHTCGVQEDGTLWCWGQAGDGRGVLTEPTRVGAGTEWAEVEAGFFHTCARRTDDSLHCWGMGVHGQLGHGHAWATEPVAVVLR